VEAPTQGGNIKELTAVKQELQKAIANLELNPNAAEDAELATLRQELKAELASVKTELDEKIDHLSVLVKDFAQRLGISLESLERLNRNHPLRTQPFLFSALPTIEEQPTQILIGGGIIFAIGNLSSAWGLDEELSLPRETIRTAQEMGINILHFAWRRRHMMQAQQTESQSVRRDSSAPPKKQRGMKNIYDKLE
jgi:hypothetical protein